MSLSLDGDIQLIECSFINLGLPSSVSVGKSQ